MNRQLQYSIYNAMMKVSSKMCILIRHQCAGKLALGRKKTDDFVVFVNFHVENIPTHGQF